MNKIAVVMSYFNRERQLLKTLASIAESEHPDYCIVIVDDASDTPLVVEGPEIIRIEPHEKTWSCPVIPYNMGIARALTYGPDIIVLQNAECYHVGDVLMYADEHVTDGVCVVFAAWGEYMRTRDVFKDIARDNPLRTDGGGTGWYSHSRWNRRGFHFCNAYSANAMRQLNGFDERFKDGAGFDDNDLERRTRELGLVKIFTDETLPFVVHQWHNRDHLNADLYQKNQIVHGLLSGESGCRAQHILTEDF